MGRIKKAAGERHEASLSPFISNFIKEATTLPLYKLYGHLASFPQQWPFPRDDLYHWIPVLNRFDDILEKFNTAYGLDKGPQTERFDTRLLDSGDGIGNGPEGPTHDNLLEARLTVDGDRYLIDLVVHFSRILIENCANRSLYASTGHLSNLLNTTDVSLVKTTLRLLLRLAQRYHASRHKFQSSHMLNVLLQGHYNISLDKLQKLANPFSKTGVPSGGLVSTPAKGKDKQTDDELSRSHVNPSDLVSIVSGEQLDMQLREELMNVRITYYDTTPTSAPGTSGTPAVPPSTASPILGTPTRAPARRTSGLGQETMSTPSRSSGWEESVETPTRSRPLDTPSLPGPKTLHLPQSQIQSTAAPDLVRDYLPQVPTEFHYDLLHKIRVAKSFVSKEFVDDIVAVRLLAIANLAYVYSDSTFNTKIAQPDSEEPRKYQLVQQLTELLQLTEKGVSTDIEIAALMTLEALTKCKSRVHEIVQALNIGVSHGVLYYVLRKVVATLAEYNEETDTLEEDEWRDSALCLISALAAAHTTHNRNAENMVTAGVLGILVEILSFRNDKAEQYFPAVVNFFDSFVGNGVRDAFSALVNAKGLDALAELSAHEVHNSLEMAQNNQGLAPEFKSKATDYQIPYYQQQTLRNLFKFIVRMFQNGTGGNERELRNLVDTPQLLSALKNVIENSTIFGSNVWSGAMNIITNFIHHEPTSYQVIAEAGLSKGLLETITQTDIVVPEGDATADAPLASSSRSDKPLASGILPISETMRDIPTAFGAICLNESGMKLFQASDALEQYLEIFLSPQHVKALMGEGETSHTHSHGQAALSIGHGFDELVRHHPPLKDRIAGAVYDMVQKVVKLCQDRARTNGAGAKLWIKGDSGMDVAGGRGALRGLSAPEIEAFQATGETDFYHNVKPEDGNAPATQAELEKDDDEGRTGTSTSEYIGVTCRFLLGFFHNQNMAVNFIERGGMESLLDLATCPCNPYDFLAGSASDYISEVFMPLAEQKPHLVIPSLLKRMQHALYQLNPMVEHDRKQAYFSTFTTSENGEAASGDASIIELNGTYTTKALVAAHSLLRLVGDLFSEGLQYTRAGHHAFFTQVNLTDVWVQLVHSLSKLHAACVWEEILLQKSIPQEWVKETQAKLYDTFSSAEANRVMGVAQSNSASESENASTEDVTSGDSQGASAVAKPRDERGIQNTKTLTFLLAQIPLSISQFFGALGKALLPKTRAPESYIKQSAARVAEALTDSTSFQLNFPPPPGVDNKDILAFEVVAITDTVQMMFDDGRSPRGLPYEILTLVLQKFMQNGNLKRFAECLTKYCAQIPEQSDPTEDKASKASLTEATLARTGAQSLLKFFSKIVQFKHIHEAGQSTVLQQHIRKDQFDYFTPGQLLVEIRNTILPAVSELWTSDVMDKLSTESSSTVIDILCAVMGAEGENNAIKRDDNLRRRIPAKKPVRKLTDTKLSELKGTGISDDLAVEALFRTNDNLNMAKEYVALRSKPDVHVSRFPPPDDEIAKPSAPGRGDQAQGSTTDQSPSRGGRPGAQRVPSVEMRDADAPPRFAMPDDDSSDSEDEDRSGTQRALPADLIASGISQLIAGGSNGGADLLAALGGIDSARRHSESGQGLETITAEPFMTVDDLNDKRAALREDLVDRCLNVLNTHSSVTFDLADLITASVPKKDGNVWMADVGQTLVGSLMSLRPDPDEDTKPDGQKIASWAHLLALVMQQPEFFKATLEELQDNFEILADFINISPEQVGESSSPWISNILLIVERVLAEDETPQKIEWNPPPADDPLQEQKIVELKAPIVPFEKKVTLFEALVEVLTKIGKDESLALSVTRVLVILTRNWTLAKRLGEKLNIQKLFVMVRQLSGITNERLQSAFLIVLRHIIEDEDTVRQVMRSEIQSAFEAARPTRPMDTTAYTRHLYHLVLRNPEIFVEITNEKVQLTRWDSSQRPQALALKKEEKKEDESSKKSKSESEQEGAGGEKTPKRMPLERTKTADMKPPTVENPDGVVQFLLRELISYKEIDDKEPQAALAASQPPKEQSADVDMLDTTPTPVSTPGLTPAPGPDTPASPHPSGPDSKASDKPAFKSQEHPIFVYRCFILQCLSELLASYNRTKVEFINFSRKAEYQASTPSKPRSGVLNYLLNSLIPVGTLNHADDTAHKKRLATANWAVTTIVSLCSKTIERTNSSSSVDEEESELVYVRKFVLEHALKAYRDAMASTEPLDQKYARLLGLADLFNRMLTAKPSSGNHSANVEPLINSSRQLGKLMYEKNFIQTLTASIAEIDLNFPNAKRAVKYILRPLKWLTDTAVKHGSSDTTAAPGTGEEDEISSATSVSDDENEREETPDLFRNSTLGQFEPDRDEDESGSDEDGDEGMYDDDFDEDMEYEEEDPAHGEVVSDDDEEIEGMEGMGEIEGMRGDLPTDIPISDDEEGDEDDDDEDDDDDDMDEDDGDEIEIIDEMTGDDENASMDEDDEDEGEDEDGEDWEDDGEEGYDEHDEDDDHDGADMSAIDNLARVINGGDDHSEILEHLHGGDLGLDMDMAGNEYFDDEMPDDEGGYSEPIARASTDIRSDQEEEEDYDGEEVLYEPELEEDDDEDGDMGWGWDDTPPAIFRSRHRHHRGDPWGLPLDDRFGSNASVVRSLFGRPTDSWLAPPYRTQRPGQSRGDDSGVNPLLQRAGQNASPSRTHRQADDSARGGLDDIARGGPFFTTGPLPNMGNFREIIEMVGPSGARINIVGGGPGGLAGLPPMFQVTGGPAGHHGRFSPFDAIQLRADMDNPLTAIIGGRPRTHRSGTFGESSFNAAVRQRMFPGTGSSDPAQAVSFVPTLTSTRWQDEARILFGNAAAEKAVNIVNSIFRLLVPPAMEAKRQRDKAEAERKAAEEKAKEEERKQAEAEKAEREEKERKEREEREAREAEEAAQRARDAAELGEAAAPESQMEGVEETQPTAPEESAAAGPRVTTTIRGRQLDITNLGIDLEYIEALPEDLREDVIMQQFAEQRSQAAQSGEQPGEIDREFLEALPPDIQAEVLRAEAHDRRRREREEARRRATASGAAPAAQPEDLGGADFLAMLDPALRQSVLMDADDATLSALPPDLQAEARAYGRERRLHHMVEGSVSSRRLPAVVDVSREHDQARVGAIKHVRRPVVQMLDKAGVATILRLMFVAMQGSARTTMHGILADLCKNTQNRAEVISILLSILQDGSADASALERSFAQLTLRAKQLSGPKTPQPVKRSLTGQVSSPNSEMSPLMIVQQCLSTLTALAHDNPRVSSFFLSEHETITSQRTKASKKGKGKETKASKFPLNALLILLDRKAIIENSAVMEHLAALLIRVTEPLKILQKRAKEAEKEKDREEGESAQDAAAPSAEAVSSDVPMAEQSQGDAATATDTEATAQAEQSTNEKSEEAKAAEKKKHRDLTPPEVPEENLCLVVNIIAARECNSKTMQNTIDIINNLSAIPGARDIFGRELVRRAQELGEHVLTDLQQLIPQIQNAKTSTDVQGLALANFSPASAHQSKLLRVLLALDYIFDPKRAQFPDRPTSESEALPQKLKDDILATLYESSTFVKLWTSLSDCLTAIRERGSLNNVATILQPLIEGFMVVCKTTTLKDKLPISAAQDVLAATPPPESRIENLFFGFTEDHRKILNDLVRHNPKLMSGTFSVLVRNSKVLDFDNKRNYFSRKLHSRTNEDRIPHPTLQLNIRRDQIFLDSFRSLYYKSANEIKYGKLSIRFHGEEGVDAGGVTREWFGALSRQMFNPDYALFNPVAADRTTFHPNALSRVNPEHDMFFRFIGRIIGKALYEGRVLDCHFSRAVYKRILGKPVSLKDMETLDLDYYKSLCWILENDITDVTFETFSMEVDNFGEQQIVDLIPDGRNIPVTEENKQEYVRLVVEQRLTKSVEEQLNNFLQGFRDIIPADLISIFNEQELELLISGLPDIDVDDWKNNTEYHNYQATSPQVQWFWRAVRSFDQEEKAKLLQFVTGTSKVPLNGFKELEGMNGFSKFNIHRDFGSKERLPSSHTCFNQLDLPEYDTYETLRQQVYTAMTAGSEYFGFA